MLANPSKHYGPLTREALKRSNALHTDSFVYFIADVEQQMVKIGKAKDVRKRLKALQTSHANELKLLGSLAGDVALEREIHKAFADERERGEWFRFSPRIGSLIKDAFRAGTNREPGDGKPSVKDPAPSVDVQIAARIPASVVKEFAEVMGLSEPEARRYIKRIDDSERARHSNAEAGASRT